MHDAITDVRQIIAITETIVIIADITTVITTDVIPIAVIAETAATFASGKKKTIKQNRNASSQDEAFLF
jgi:hypothetical protein